MKKILKVLLGIIIGVFVVAGAMFFADMYKSHTDQTADPLIDKEEVESENNDNKNDNANENDSKSSESPKSQKGSKDDKAREGEKKKEERKKDREKQRERDEEKYMDEVITSTEYLIELFDDLAHLGYQVEDDYDVIYTSEWSDFLYSTTFDIDDLMYDIRELTPPPSMIEVQEELDAAMDDFDFVIINYEDAVHYENENTLYEISDKVESGWDHMRVATDTIEYDHDGPTVDQWGWD